MLVKGNEMVRDENGQLPFFLEDICHYKIKIILPADVLADRRSRSKWLRKRVENDWNNFDAATIMIFNDAMNFGQFRSKIEFQLDMLSGYNAKFIVKPRKKPLEKPGLPFDFDDAL